MIRKLQKTDVEKVADIWLDGNLNTHHFVSGQYWIKNFEIVKRMFLQTETYVFEKQGEVQGFIGFDGDYIEGIFVKKEVRSTGIGKCLMDFAKNNKRLLSLNVYVKNTKAVKFYLRENFEIQCENIDEKTGEKEFLMVWKEK